MGRGPSEIFAEAAIDWAAGGRGQPLVDAAAEALVAGLDSLTLRILAGARRANADLEATELAPTVFEELGIQIHDRLSPEAIIAGARQKARRFLSEGGSPRRLTQDLSRMYLHAGYPVELSAWSGLDDWYDLLDSRVVAGHIADVDNAVTEAAHDLVDGLPIDRQPRERLFTGKRRGWRGFRRRR